MAEAEVKAQPTRMLHVVCGNCRHEWLVKREQELAACPRCSNVVDMRLGPQLVRLGVER